jgi:hypothetical protein
MQGGSITPAMTAMGVRDVAVLEEGEKIPDHSRSMARTLSDLLYPNTFETALDDLIAKGDTAFKLAALIAQMSSMRRHMDAVVNISETSPIGANIGAYVVLVRLCEFGSNLNQILGGPSTKYFDLSWHQKIGQDLGITDDLLQLL